MRRFILGAGEITSAGRAGLRGGITVVHGLAVSPTSGAPDLRVSGLPPSAVRPVGEHLFAGAQLVLEVLDEGEVFGPKGEATGASPFAAFVSHASRRERLVESILAAGRGQPLWLDAIAEDESNEVALALLAMQRRAHVDAAITADGARTRATTAERQRCLRVLHHAARSLPGAPSFEQLVAHAADLIAFGTDVPADPTAPEET